VDPFNGSVFTITTFAPARGFRVSLSATTPFTTCVGFCVEAGKHKKNKNTKETKYLFIVKFNFNSE
jgi:hypothetical protein